MNSKILWIVTGGIIIIFAAALLWKDASQNGIYSFIPGMQPATSTTATTTGGVKVTETMRTSSDVASIASSIAGASTFASLFSSTGVKAVIKGKGPYTIFVPTDASIAHLPKGTISKLSAAEKTRLVEYHVIKGQAVDPAAVRAGNMTALSGDVLNFTVSDVDQVARINSAIIVKSYKGSNGVVYLISQVLFPPTPHVTNQN